MGNRVAHNGAPAGSRGHGYTLLELIAVITLIGIVFFLAAPRLHDTFLVDQNRRALVRIMNTVRALKAASLREQVDYFLHCDIDANRLWVTNETMDDEGEAEAREKATALPRSLELTGVEYPGQDLSATGQCDIRFRRQGISDMAVIHLEEDHRQEISIVIRPFMPGATLYEKRYQYDR